MVAYPIFTFLGFAAGRFGHIFGGQILFIPHHWILGIVIMIAVIFLRKIPMNWRVLIFYFGLGVFVSDFVDFTHLRFFDPENVNVVKFWAFD